MKGEQKPLIIFPLISSLILYVGILVCIGFYLGYQDEVFKKYRSKKDNFLQISITQKEKSILKPIQQTNKMENIPKIEPTKIEKSKQEMIKTSTKESVELKSLFGKIKTKDIKPQKKIAATNKELTKKSRLKPKKSLEAKKVANSLNLKSAPSLSNPSSSGEYDKFRGQIQEMLDGFWNQTIGTQSGSEANVKILIDENGNFSYDIVNFSYNNDFNKKLREFLEDMQSVQFPKNINKVPPLTIKFKDSLE